MSCKQNYERNQKTTYTIDFYYFEAAKFQLELFEITGEDFTRSSEELKQQNNGAVVLGRTVAAAAAAAKRADNAKIVINFGIQKLKTRNRKIQTHMRVVR